MGTVFEYLSEVRARRGAGYLVLLDPDRLPPEALEQRAVAAAEAGADAILIGTSLMFSASRNAQTFARLRARVQIP